MSTLLHIDSSPRGERSVSRQLTHEFAETWKNSHPGATAIYRDLGHHPVPHVDETWIASAFNSPETRTPEQQQALALSEQLIRELEQADHYLFGVPMYNLSVPSTFKAYIDQVVRVGRTFGFGESGLVGLLTGKKATVITASGNVFRPGTPTAAWNFQEPYVRGILGFMGITDVDIIVADGLNDVNFGKVDRQEYLKPIRAQIQAKAAAFS